MRHIPSSTPILRLPFGRSRSGASRQTEGATPVPAYLARRWPLLAIPALAIATMWPMYVGGIPEGHDTFFHVWRTAILDFNLRSGLLFTRWVPQFALGYGLPVFGYYPPTVYYMAVVFHMLGLPILPAMMAVLLLFVAIGGLGMYVFARDVIAAKSVWPALISATAYMYSPYLLTNMYVRDAMAEVGAQALLPWIMWSARRLLLFRDSRAYILPLVLSLGGLAAMHSPSLVIVPPVLVGYLAAVAWTHRRQRLEWRWLTAAIALAAGVSCAAWLPIVAGRVDLADTAYGAAIQSMPKNVFRLDNLINKSTPFGYTDHAPFKLGAIQLGLGVLGLLLARRRDFEWWYWAIIAAALLLLASWPLLPVWTSSEVLLVIQFPWRLLSIVGLALALLTGGILLPLRGTRLRGVVAALLVSLVVYANLPQGQPMQPAHVEADLQPARLAEFEAWTGEYGAMWHGSREFFPRAVNIGERISLTSKLEPERSGMRVQVTNGGDLGVEAAVTSDHGGVLRTNVFFFPGWEAVMDGSTRLPAFASTNLGLLTVEVPPGTHHIAIRWAETPVQRLATVISLVSLGALTALCWGYRRRTAFVPVVLLIASALLAFWPAPSSPVTAPREPLGDLGLTLVGYRTQQVYGNHLYLYPYWWVAEELPESLQVRWQLRDASETVVTETVSKPYYGAVPANQWPPDTLADDAYDLILPPGLPGGEYQLYGEILMPGSSSRGPVQLGQVTIRENDETGDPTHRLDARANNGMLLQGYDLKVDGRMIQDAQGKPTVATPGDTIEYILYWRAIGELPEDYHGFVHLVDHRQNLLVQDDRALGEPFALTSAWNPSYTVKERYWMVVPADASPGLYWPQVGVYTPEELKLQPFYAVDGQPMGDSLRLPPIKVYRRGAVTPANSTYARLADFGDLIGYDLAAPPGGLRPGDSFDLTLYYRVDRAPSGDFTRFAHLYSPERGMAAQADGIPAADGNHRRLDIAGGLRAADRAVAASINPVSSWLPGETVADHLRLTVDSSAEPGEYDLLVGFYVPENGQRLPLTDRDGKRLRDDQATLLRLEVKP